MTLGKSIKIEAFDKANLKLVRTDIDQALQAIGAKYGISLRMGSGRFSPESATLKIEAKATGKVASDGFAKSMKALYNLTAGVPVNGKTLIDYKRSAHKYPFVYRDEITGKSYKCDRYTATRYFAPL